MPAKREYNVKGTNDFLILAVIFFFLCIWAIKDAWFPSESVLKKHPLQVDVAFATAGTVQDVSVTVGDAVIENQVIAELRSERTAVAYETAKNAYAESKKELARLEWDLKERTENEASVEETSAMQQRIDELRQMMDTTLDEVNDLRVQLDSAELKAPTKGQVIEVLVAPHTMVEAGQTAVVIDPKDHFYLFNKSLTVLSFILFWVFLAIHILGR